MEILRVCYLVFWPSQVKKSEKTCYYTNVSTIPTNTRVTWPRFVATHYNFQATRSPRIPTNDTHGSCNTHDLRWSCQDPGMFFAKLLLIWQLCTYIFVCKHGLWSKLDFTLLFGIVMGCFRHTWNNCWSLWVVVGDALELWCSFSVVLPSLRSLCDRCDWFSANGFSKNF